MNLLVIKIARGLLYTKLLLQVKKIAFKSDHKTNILPAEAYNPIIYQMRIIRRNLSIKSVCCKFYRNLS